MRRSERAVYALAHHTAEAETATQGVHVTLELPQDILMTSLFTDKEQKSRKPQNIIQKHV